MGITELEGRDAVAEFARTIVVGSAVDDHFEDYDPCWCCW
jgi:hypothetical protein